MPGQYRKGANFERQIKDFLEGEGWDVTRSAGSHTVKDLVAIKPNPSMEECATPWVWYIQCKTDGRIKPNERDTLLELERRLGIIPMLASRIKGKVVFGRIMSKEPTFYYKLVNGRFIRVDK